MSKPSVLAIGFSHLGAIIRAQEARSAARSNSTDFNFINFNLAERHRPFFVTKGGKNIFNEAIKADMLALIESKRPVIIIASLWSNHHFIYGTFNNPLKFDFVLPGAFHQGLSEGAKLVPYDLIHAFMDERCAPNYQLIPFFRSFTSLPILSLSAPPPIENLSELDGGTLIDTIDPNLKGLEIAPPSLRFKIWKLCECIFRDHARGSNVTFLPVPFEAMAKSGFRRQEFVDIDWLHASTSYGELVLRQIDHQIASMQQG